MSKVTGAAGLAGAVLLVAGCWLEPPASGTLTITLTVPVAVTGSSARGVVYDPDTMQVEATAFGQFASPVTLTFEEYDINGTPTGTMVTLSGGEHVLFIRAAPGGGWYEVGDPAYIGPVTIDGDTVLTPADTDEIVEVFADVNFTVADGAKLWMFWQIDSSPALTELSLVIDDLPGVAFGNAAAFDTYTAQFHERVFVAGTYDVSLLLDVHDNGVLDSGDRHVQIQDVVVTNGATFDFSAELNAATPIP